MRLKHTLCLTTLTLALAWTAAAATVETTTGDLTFHLADGTPLVFEAPVNPNLGINAPFETAMLGQTINGFVNLFNFATQPTDLDTGRYTVELLLRVAPPSPASITVTGANTFEAMLDVYLEASFNWVDNGCGASCGDVIGEFGSLPGLENCDPGPGTSTCEATGRVLLIGNYVPGPGGGIDDLVDGGAIAPAAVPEPSSLWLVALGAGLLVRKRF